MDIRGWLFDLYPLESSMILWIKGEDGLLYRLKDSFRPRFYAGGRRRDLLNLFDYLNKNQGVAGFEWTKRKELWSGDEVDVMEIELGGPEHYIRLRRILPRWEETITFYNCDIPLPQVYLYERGLFPTGRCIAEVEGERIFKINPDPAESVWRCEEEISDIRTMELRLINQNSSKALLLECERYRLEMEYIDLDELSRFLRHFDPDLILSDDGDGFLLPHLFSLEKRYKASVPWDREPSPLQRCVTMKGRSYFSYGRTYYQAPAQLLFGRWHIDCRNSFIYKESGMDGVVELARLAKIPIQRMARTSPGTAITSMQLDRAFKDGILIPWRKGEPEHFKTAWDLLISDKGGLVFQPRLGVFENVAEIDFSSMYPTIMAIHNISPETVLCRCCRNHRVPEVGYTICERREGIVPKTLKPILERRGRLKEMIKRLREKTENECEENHKGERGRNFGEGNMECGASPIPPSFEEGEREKREIYNRKQIALKWMLVTCFGYLGYRNARFGKIEAHEAVTAFGREKLLQAKEICEEEGFELLHAITDSLWIHKKDLCEKDVERVCKRISDVTGITMGIEGIYRWLVFLPSKGNPESPVANRYFGLFRSGKIKARGLMFRRGDIPPLIQDAQIQMLEILKEAEDVEGFQSKIPEILNLLLEYCMRLREWRTKYEDLAIAKRISQRPDEYKVDSLTALAVQQLEDLGIEIHPGEKVKYLIKNALCKDKEERVRPFPLVGADDTYDVEKYTEMLLKATEELLIHFGYNSKKLIEMIKGSSISINPIKNQSISSRH